MESARRTFRSPEKNKAPEESIDKLGTFPTLPCLSTAPQLPSPTNTGADVAEVIFRILHVEVAPKNPSDTYTAPVVSATQAMGPLKVTVPEVTVPAVPQLPAKLDMRPVTMSILRTQFPLPSTAYNVLLNAQTERG